MDTLFNRAPEEIEVVVVGGRGPGDVPLSGACHSAVWKRRVGDAVTLNGKFNKDNGSGSAE